MHGVPSFHTTNLCTLSALDVCVCEKLSCMYRQCVHVCVHTLLPLVGANFSEF